MSPGFERRLARIDKALDRIRHARDEESARIGLAETHIWMATLMTVYEELGQEAFEWVLDGEGEPPECIKNILHHQAAKDTKPRAAQEINSTTEAQRH